MGKIAYFEEPESDLDHFDVICFDRGLPLLPIFERDTIILKKKKVKGKWTSKKGKTFHRHQYEFCGNQSKSRFSEKNGDERGNSDDESDRTQKESDIWRASEESKIKQIERSVVFKRDTVSLLTLLFSAKTEESSHGRTNTGFTSSKEGSAVSAFLVK